MTVRIWTHRVARDEDFTESRWMDPEPILRLDLRAPHRLAGTWRSPAVEVVSESPPADTFDCGPARIVSERLASILRGHVPPSDHELLPVDVYVLGERRHGFSILHVIPKLDALDRSRARFELHGTRVSVIEKLAIDDARATAALFELDALDWVTCVSEPLAREVEAAGCTGVAFETPDEWRRF